MFLLSPFKRKSRPKPPKSPSNAEMEVLFQKWYENVTIPEIRILFFDTLIYGHEATSGLVKAREKAYFDSITQQLLLSPDTQHILPSSTINLLKQLHGPKSSAIEAAAPLLEALLTSHAYFPFADPLPLTPTTLLQAILLLTWRCKNYFKQSVSINGDDTIRSRPTHRRLLFIYSALSHPPTGCPTHHDVVDVLCRIEYPMGRYAKPQNEPVRKRVTELEPLAERLMPEGKKEQKPDPVAVKTLEPLVELVRVFPSRWEEPVKDVEFGVQQVVSGEAFVRWAVRIRLLDVLDQVFSGLLHETEAPPVSGSST
ncbi:hypothetical protein N0V90_000157 [Kalmusia sp. IMI 367209]|nr:hypothetical protein N0V90_000157 [Kalmusia sp. IMI 367209]